MMAFPPVSYDIFLSYALADTAFAEQMIAGLQKYGYTIWTDRVDEASLPASSAGIQACQSVIFLLSPASLATQIEADYQVALSLRKPIFLLLYQATPIPAVLAYLPVLDFTQDAPQHMSELLFALQQQGIIPGHVTPYSPTRGEPIFSEEASAIVVPPRPLYVESETLKRSRAAPPPPLTPSRQGPQRSALIVSLLLAVLLLSIIGAIGITWKHLTSPDVAKQGPTPTTSIRMGTTPSMPPNAPTDTPQASTNTPVVITQNTPQSATPTAIAPTNTPSLTAVPTHTPVAVTPTTAPTATSTSTIPTATATPPPVVFTLNVQNPTKTPLVSPSGIIIHSADNVLTCTLISSVNVPAGGAQSQQCQIGSAHPPADVWNDTTSNPPLVYQGSSPG